PSFSRFWLGRIDSQINLSDLFQLADVSMQRRGLSLSAGQRKLLVSLFEETAEEREQAIQWWDQKLAARPAPQAMP
ncbi:MAG: hypothetical protein KDA77_22405, partial [Planctomycetaceae bacterium]|nr:hypothetical protein [Planctomycetaceae bacterium]